MGPQEKFWLTNNLLLKKEKREKKYSTTKNLSNWFHFLLLIQSKTHVLQEKIQFPEVLHNISFWCFTFLLLLFPSLSLFCIFFHPPFLFLSSPLCRYFFNLIFIVLLSPTEFLGIFSSPLSISFLPLS